MSSRAKARDLGFVAAPSLGPSSLRSFGTTIRSSRDLGKAARNMPPKRSTSRSPACVIPRRGLSHLERGGTVIPRRGLCHPERTRGISLGAASNIRSLLPLVVRDDYSRNAPFGTTEILRVRPADSLVYRGFCLFANIFELVSGYTSIAEYLLLGLAREKHLADHRGFLP